MLVEAGHDLDEVAGAVAVVELVQQDAVPGVLAGAGRAGDAEDVGRARHARGRAGLNGRGPDLGVAHHQEQGGEAVHAFFKEWLERLRRHVAACEAGAPRGDDHVDGGIGDPLLHASADLLNVVGDDGAVGDRMTRLLDTLDERGAGPIVRKVAGVRHGEHRDLQRDELPGLVDAGHGWSRQRCE